MTLVTARPSILMGVAFDCNPILVLARGLLKFCAPYLCTRADDSVNLVLMHLLYGNPARPPFVVIEHGVPTICNAHLLQRYAANNHL